MADWYREYFDAWDAQDLEAILSWVTDDATFEDTTIGHSATGTEELRRFITASFTNVPEARFDVIGGVDDGDRYAIEWVMQPMSVRGVSVGRLRDGKIAENRDYWDGRAFDVPNT